MGVSDRRLISQTDLLAAYVARRPLDFVRVKHLQLANRDLSGLVLRDANLSAADIGGASLADADLASSTFQRVLAPRACFDRAMLRATSIAWTDLREASSRPTRLSQPVCSVSH